MCLWPLAFSTRTIARKPRGRRFGLGDASMGCFRHFRRKKTGYEKSIQARLHCYQAKMNAIHGVSLQTRPRTIHSRPAPRIYALAALKSPRLAQRSNEWQGLAIFAAHGRPRGRCDRCCCAVACWPLAHCKMHGRNTSERSHRVGRAPARSKKSPRRPSSSRSRSRPPRRSSARRRPRRRRS